ncbi:AAWKG family protein [Streptomyces cucumeris]|uniref:AAWKG family protein n=1 Tax=Streptomyces cucumeris TaxID=2962890 RepID=UPI0027E53B67|nr:AAWKG family protein [Streptomyces sp. NEAU-Y11]
MSDESKRVFPAHSTDDYWHLAVKVLTGYEAPLRQDLFGDLLGNDKIPLMRVEFSDHDGEPSNATLDAVNDMEWRTENSGWRIENTDFVVPFYSGKHGSIGDAAVGTKVKMKKARVTLLGTAGTDSPPAGGVVVGGDFKSKLGKDFQGQSKDTVWSNKALSQYSYGTGRALDWLLKHGSTIDFDWNDLRVENKNAVNLESFKDAAEAYDRAAQFFAHRYKDLQDWEFDLGKEEASWKGQAAGVFRDMIHGLARNYESYSEQFPVSGSLHSKYGNDLRKFRTDIETAVRKLQAKWDTWQRLTGNPLRWLHDILLEVTDDVWDNNIKKVRYKISSTYHGVGTRGDHKVKFDGFYGGSRKYGPLEDKETWKKIGEEAIKRWQQSVIDVLGTAGKQALIDVQNSFNDQKFPKKIDTATTSLSEQFAKDQAAHDRAEQKKKEEAAEKRAADAEKKAEQRQEEADRKAEERQKEQDRKQEEAEKRAEQKQAEQEAKQEQKEKEAEEKQAQKEKEAEQKQAEQEAKQEQKEKEAEEKQAEQEKKAEQKEQEQESKQAEKEQEAEQKQAEQEAKQEQKEKEAEQKQAEQEKKAEQRQQEQEQQQVIATNTARAEREQQKKEQQRKEAEQEAKQEQKEQEAEQKQAEQEKKAEQKEQEAEKKQEEKEKEAEQQRIKTESEYEAKQAEQEAKQAEKEKEAEQKQAEQEAKQEQKEQEAEQKQAEQEKKAEKLQQEQEAKQEQKEQEAEQKQAEQEKKAEKLQQEQEAKQEQKEKEAEQKQAEQEAKQEQKEQEAEKRQQQLEAEQEQKQKEAEERYNKQAGELGLGGGRGLGDLGPDSGLPGENGATTTLNSDGSVTLDSPDGSSRTIDLPSGDVSTTLPDGSHISDSLSPGHSITNGDGSVTTMNRDGTLTTEFPDGSRSVLDPDKGTLTNHQPDGTTVTTPIERGQTLPSELGGASLPGGSHGGSVYSPSYDGEGYEEELYDQLSNSDDGQRGLGSGNGPGGGMPMLPPGTRINGMTTGGGANESERVRGVMDDGQPITRRVPSQARGGYQQEEVPVATRGGTSTMSGGMPFMPPGGGMGGGGQQTESADRERASWMEEDEDVWGTDEGGAPAVIGR